MLPSISQQIEKQLMQLWKHFIIINTEALQL